MLSEVLWVFLVLAAWVFGFQLVRHYRRKTAGYVNYQVFKARLPSWVKQLEFYCFAGGLTAYGLLGAFGVTRLYHVLHPHAEATGLAAVLTMLAVIFPAIAFAMLTANLISWMIPAARAANLQAMSGVANVSFGSLNRGLLLFALILTPVCVIQELIGLFEPWAR